MHLAARSAKVRRPVEAGATAVEYSLLLAGIAAVIIGVVRFLGLEVAALFTGMIGTF